MSAAVIGASGYSGVELVKILALHPQVELAAVTSRTLVGEKVADSDSINCSKVLGSSRIGMLYHNSFSLLLIFLVIFSANRAIFSRID